MQQNPPLSTQSPKSKVEDVIHSIRLSDSMKETLNRCSSLTELATLLEEWNKEQVIDLASINTITNKYGELLISASNLPLLQKEIDNISSILPKLANNYFKQLGDSKISGHKLSMIADVPITGAAMTALYKTELEFYSLFNNLVEKSTTVNLEAKDKLENIMNELSKKLYADSSSSFSLFTDKLTNNRNQALERAGISHILKTQAKSSSLFPEIAGEGYIKDLNSSVEVVINHKRELASALDAIKENNQGRASNISFTSRDIKGDDTIYDFALFLELNPHMAAIIAHASTGIKLSTEFRDGLKKKSLFDSVKEASNTTAAVLVGTGYGIIGTVMTLTPPTLAAALTYELSILALSSASVTSTVTLFGIAMPAIIPIAVVISAIVGSATLIMIDQEYKLNSQAINTTNAVVGIINEAILPQQRLTGLNIQPDQYINKNVIVDDILKITKKAFVKYYEQGYDTIKTKEAVVAQNNSDFRLVEGVNQNVDKLSQNLIDTFTRYEKDYIDKAKDVASKAAKERQMSNHEENNLFFNVRKIYTQETIKGLTEYGFRIVDENDRAIMPSSARTI